MTRTETRYVVRRNTFNTYQGEGDTGSRVPLAVFTTRAVADAHAAELITHARRTVNPFTVYDTELRELSADAVRALDFEFAVWPPPDTRYGGPDWAAWYDAEQPHLSDAERALVWGLFAGAPLFEVAEIEWSEE